MKIMRMESGFLTREKRESRSWEDVQSSRRNTRVAREVEESKEVGCVGNFLTCSCLPCIRYLPRLRDSNRDSPLCCV